MGRWPAAVREWTSRAKTRKVAAPLTGSRALKERIEKVVRSESGDRRRRHSGREPRRVNRELEGW